MTMPIYLDNAATTRCDRRVLDAMLPYFDEQYGNPSSRSHLFGWSAEEAVSTARDQVAQLLGARGREIVFTSGATESNNLAIKGVARANRCRGNHIVTCATEHKSVLDSCRRLEEDGFEVTYLPVDRRGRVSFDDVEHALGERTILVTLMAANNEVGTLHPIREIAQLCREREIAMHVDATQAAGKVPLDVRELPVDLVSLSAHKFYGPKGVGALYVRTARPRRMLDCQIEGGGHQDGLRSGTLPVPLIVGFGVASELAVESMSIDRMHSHVLRDRLERRIVDGVPGAIVNGHAELRLPNITSISFPGVDSEALLTSLPTIAASAGSACTSASLKPSHVLSAMGVSPDVARSTLRLSVGRFTTLDEVDAAAKAIVQAVQRLTPKASEVHPPRVAGFAEAA
jgi:cysteine desulfurase